MKKLKYTRNIGIVAHIDAGKTTTTERILYYTGISHKIGEVHEGNTTMDWMEQEQERGITITSAATRCIWKYNKRNYYINIIDTPGHVDFTVEVERSLRVLDGMVVLFSSVEGVEPQSETVWKQANKYKIPRIGFVNKMDRKGSNYFKVCKEVKRKLNCNTIILQLPLEKEEKFIGIIDIILEKYIIWENKNYGMKYYIKDIPDNEKEKIKEYKIKLLENLSEYDEEIMNNFLEGKKIKNKKIISVIKKETCKMNLVPMLCGSSFKNKGVQKMLDAICMFLPSPLKAKKIIGIDKKNKKKCIVKPDYKYPYCSFVFKISTNKFFGKLVFIRVYSGTLKVGEYVLNSRTNKKERISRMYQMHANKQIPINKICAGDIFAGVGLKDIKTGDTLCEENKTIVLENIYFPKPVMGIAIETKIKSDIEKLNLALSKMEEEDPTFKVKMDNKTGQIIIYGMGELHLDIIIDRIKREFNIEINKGKPKVEYKEKITKKITHREIYKKQTGGRGKFAEILFTIGPYKKKGLKFINKVKGGNIPKEYITSIEKGFKNSMQIGPLLGYEIDSMEIELLDGSYHSVDSDSLSFEIAAKNGYRNSAIKTKPIIMEPIMKLVINCQNDKMGNIVSDINKRRGIIKNIIDNKNNEKIIKSLVPLSEMFGYVTILRSLSSGRANYNMSFSHYEEVHKNFLKKIIDNKL
ncbi:elongation factor G [Candidatus Shikimatogenerans bostrichidophilus]|uniref:elongation factor G n=1 Tax=Candidatus Shikimatogenerans bostrichidophilus TaxID=2943807 RepID=UPI002966A15B